MFGRRGLGGELPFLSTHQHPPPSPLRYLCRAASLILDAHGDVVLGLVHVGVRAVDRKAAGALRDDGAGRAGAVAPINGRGEIARRRIRVRIGEGRNRRVDRLPSVPLTVAALFITPPFRLNPSDSPTGDIVPVDRRSAKA